MVMAEKAGMVDKLCPIPHYFTIHRLPLEVAHPWRLCNLGGCLGWRKVVVCYWKRREMLLSMRGGAVDDA